MKKHGFWALLLAVATAFAPLGSFTACAARPVTVSGFGRLAADQANFEGALRRNCALHGTQATENGFDMAISDEDCYRGSKSLRVDYQSGCRDALVVSETGSSYHHVLVDSDMRVGRILFEVYMKGVPEDGTIAPRLYGNGGGLGEQSTTFEREETEKTGWYRYYLSLDLSEVDEETESITWCVRWERESDSDDSADIFYIDDMTAYYLPQSIDIKSGTSSKRTVPLDKLNAKGIGSDGEADRILAEDRIEYTVLSGAAEICGRELIYYGPSGGRVELKASLLGIEDEFYIDFDI